MKIFNKKKLLILFSTVIISGMVNAQETKSPFEKYDPNQRLNAPVVTGKNNPNQSTRLSQEQEMQVRDLIFQELSLKEEAVNMQKLSGVLDYDDSEVLFLGQNEVLKGTAKKQYIIFDSSTNLFRYVSTEDFKKVVTYQERISEEGEEDNGSN